MTKDGLNLKWHAFSAAKAGNAPEEYEDAVAGDPAAGRFAVADGATESSFAAAWARLLVEGFVTAAGRPWRSLDWIAPLRQRWASQVDTLVLPWFAETKREEGAFATLLGVAFRSPRGSDPGVWRAVAVGDCCLFRTRRSRLLGSFPLTASKDFSNRPRLLGSRVGALPKPDEAAGRWRPGDRFLLMSDALAQWFLERTEKKADPLGEIATLLSGSAPQDAFPSWLGERRRQGLRNDDVTLAIIDP